MKSVPAKTVVEIPVNKVREGDLNIRKYYDEETISELGRSISEIGTIYPIVVKPLSDGEYELIIGSRRLRAAKRLRLSRIPAFVIPDLDARHQLELTLAENLHREDMTPFEEAWAILKLINDFKMTAHAVAKRIGRPAEFVRRRIQLLSLPEEAQELLSKKRLSIAHVSTLASLGSHEDQVQFARVAAKHSLSPEELTTHIREENALRRAERSHARTEFTGKKIALKIKTFTKWVERGIPETAKMPHRDMLEIRAALKDLEREVARALESIKKKGG